MAANSLCERIIMSTNPEPPKISKEQFREKIEDFFNWAAQYDRLESSWFCSLKDWADMQFNESFERDHPKEK